jgi:hypothetical protein
MAKPSPPNPPSGNPPPPSMCWCGVENPHYAPITEGCGDSGVCLCFCGGDFCVCHNHGEIECWGCEDCQPIEGENGDH